MKPLSSIATQPRSHSVRGDAPVMTNTCWTACVEFSPVFLSCHTTRSRRVPPSSADDLGIQVQLNPRILRQPLDQVSRHGARQLRSPAPACAPCWRFAKGRPRPARRSFPRPPRQPLPSRTTATRCKSRRSRYPALRTSPDFQARLVVLRPRGDHDGARGHASRRCRAPPRNAAPPQLSRTTLRAIIISAPNFCACVVARAASSCPETPVGNPR